MNARLVAPEQAGNPDIPALLARAEGLCRAVAPLDLGDEPLYIIAQSSLPADRGGRSVAYGFTTPNLDLCLQDVIGPAWRGRGGCFVLGDAELAGLDAFDAEAYVTSVALHELAHILDRPPVDRGQEGGDPNRLLFESLCIGRAVAQDPSPVDEAASFEAHGLRFIRAALHLRHRAVALGALVPLYCYCAGSQYGLSHPLRYREALGDEPARLADRPIRDILAAPCPEAFSRLWAADVAHWHSHRSTSSKGDQSNVHRKPD